MPEVVDDSVFIADNTVELSQLNEISAIVPNSKGMSSSQWKITPLKGTDVEESVDENGIGNRRRDSVDNLFEIVPNCSIAGSGEDGGGDFCGRVRKMMHKYNYYLSVLNYEIFECIF